MSVETNVLLNGRNSGEILINEGQVSKKLVNVLSF